MTGAKGTMMRAFFALLFCVAVLAPASAADSYPTRPIKLLIPFPPAGITDLSGRIVAEALRAKLGQPVVVENKAGANGVLGLRELLKSDADLTSRLRDIGVTITEMSGKAGDVYLMDMRILHTPSINDSKNFRMMATCRFLLER